jgi:5'(3')-deoxyribonucleotidase
MSETKFVLGVDLDGVVADFYAGLRPIAAEWLGVGIETLPMQVTWNLAEWGVPEAPGGYDALHRFAVTQRNLFRELKPIPGAPAALRRLSKAQIRIRVITHRLCIEYSHQQAVRQTVEWLDFYDVPYWDLCFMKDKAAVGADLYVEDSPSNVKTLREDGHQAIVFTNSTNLTLGPPRADSWAEVERLAVDACSRWTRKSAAEDKSLSGT